MRYKSIIWHLLLIHCFSNTALINLNTDIKAKLIKMSRIISFHRECSLGIIFNEKGFFKNSKNEIMPLLQSYSNFLDFKNPWGAVFTILHLCFLFFSIRWKGLFPNAGKAPQSTTVLVFKNTVWDQRTVEICRSWLFWEWNDINAWCNQTIFDTNMLKSFHLFSQSWKAYSDRVVSENPCRGQGRNEHITKLLFS